MLKLSLMSVVDCGMKDRRSMPFLSSIHGQGVLEEGAAPT